MNVSQATSQITDIKKTYVIRALFLLVPIYLLYALLVLAYILPYYTEVFWSDLLINKMSFLYSDNGTIQIAIFIIYAISLFLVAFVLNLIIFYKLNTKYQKEYLRVVINELKLNSIDLIAKRNYEENANMDFMLKTLNLNNMEKEHLFTFKSLFEMSFYQLFSNLHIKNKNSILISSVLDTGINGYIQLRFNTDFTIEEFNDEGIFQYSFANTRKYSHDLYANSNLKKKTYTIISENVIQTMLQLKKYTRENIVVTITDKLFYIWIPNWELKLTDNLFKKIKYDEMDKKVEVFTELIDEITDLYIFLINKEDIWEKKW